MLKEWHCYPRCRLNSLLNTWRKITQRPKGPHPHSKYYQVYEIICKILFLMDQNKFFKVVAVDSRVLHFPFWNLLWRLAEYLAWRGHSTCWMSKWNQWHIIPQALPCVIKGILSFNLACVRVCMCTHTASLCLNYVYSYLFLHIVAPCNLCHITYWIYPLCSMFSSYL